MFIALRRFVLTMQVNIINCLIEIIVIERYLYTMLTGEQSSKQILHSQIDLTNFHSIRVILSQLFIHDDLFGQFRESPSCKLISMKLLVITKFVHECACIDE